MVLLTDVYRILTSLWIKTRERAFKQFKSPVLNVLRQHGNKSTKPIRSAARDLELLPQQPLCTTWSVRNKTCPSHFIHLSCYRNCPGCKRRRGPSEVCLCLLHAPSNLSYLISWIIVKILMMQFSPPFCHSYCPQYSALKQLFFFK